MILPLAEQKKSELLTLMNVGNAVSKDLELLGITTIKDLAIQHPLHLFEKLEALTRVKQNPCMKDIFIAIIHEAKTGEKTPWWYWSSRRKNNLI